MGGDERVHCGHCEGDTNHEVLAQHAEIHDWGDKDLGVDHEAYKVVRCRGCDIVSFVHRSRNDELELSTVDRYPERRERHSVDVELVIVLPAKVGEIYAETVRISNIQAPLLTAVGLRAIVEAVCLDKQCSARTLQGRIDELVSRGAITKDHADLLHMHRLLGNDAAHEIEAPTREELDTGLRIVDGILRALYVLPELGQGMRQARTTRTGKP